MKKILFITWTFSMGGGAEKMLSTLVNHLDEEKFEIDILEIGRFGTNLEKTKDNVRILKPMLNPIKDSKLVHYFKWQLLKYAPYILRLFRTKKKYDYEIAFNYLYPVYALNKTSKSIAWNHGSIYNLLNDEKNIMKLDKKL